jgi:hypothetical protein
MTASTHPVAEHSLPLKWLDFEDEPILFSNHFLVQHQPNEFVLTFGQVTGPPVVGPPGQIRDQARDFGQVPIHALARLGLTRHRLVELIAMLQTTLDEHDRILGPSP